MPISTSVQVRADGRNLPQFAREEDRSRAFPQFHLDLACTGEPRCRFLSFVPLRDYLRYGSGWHQIEFIGRQDTIDKLTSKADIRGIRGAGSVDENSQVAPAVAWSHILRRGRHIKLHLVHPWPRGARK